MRIRSVTLLVVTCACLVAGLLAGHTSGTARAAAAPAPAITGTFTGINNQNGVVTNWSGSARYAPLESGTCCGITSGSISWSVSGSDSSSGCSYSGSGRVTITDGKLAGIPVQGSVTVGGGIYSIALQSVATGPIPGYNAFPVTVSCPNEKPFASQMSIGDWIYGGYGGPYKVDGTALRGHDEYGFQSGSVTFMKKWTWNFTAPPKCPQPNTRTGRGYDGLTARMKARLTVLYGILDGQNACYRFVIGFRDKSVQQGLYDRWHKIADGHKQDANVCKKLRAAGFAQCPTGWKKNGDAKGGPAKPGSSRHEHAEAADIKVTFPPRFLEDNARYRAAAHQAGLCGPAKSDPVHVELPYKKGRQKTASCHFD